jgi:hypothetical protein
MDDKMCGTCKQCFAPTIEWFSKDSSKNDGLKTICKSCERIKNHNRYVANKEEHNRKSKAYYEANKEQIHLQTKQYRKANAEKIKEQKRRAFQEYLLTHREEHNARTREYKIQRRAELNEKSRIYYQNNKEKHKDSCRRWNKANRNKCSYSTQKYRNIKRGLTCTLTLEEWEQTKKEFGNKCAYCGKTRNLVQEHYVPVSLAGSFTKENIVPSCASCNNSKNNKLFADWYPTFKHYSKEREQKVIQYIELAQIASQV